MTLDSDPEATLPIDSDDLSLEVVSRPVTYHSAPYTAFAFIRRHEATNRPCLIISHAAYTRSLTHTTQAVHINISAMHPQPISLQPYTYMYHTLGPDTCATTITISHTMHARYTKHAPTTTRNVKARRTSHPIRLILFTRALCLLLRAKMVLDEQVDA
jgi:mRNA-degrading endonuclease toxin of MazEF toxin-antitoxin module